MVIELRCYAMKCAGGSNPSERIWFPGLLKLCSEGKKECLKEQTKEISGTATSGIRQIGGYGQGTDLPGKVFLLEGLTALWKKKKYCLKMVLWGKIILVLFLTSWGEPTWQHRVLHVFVRRKGWINPLGYTEEPSAQAAKMRWEKPNTTRLGCYKQSQPTRLM